MVKIKGYSGNAFGQFFLTYKLWMMLPQIPYYRRYIIYSLVVCHKNTRPSNRNVVWIIKSKSRTQDIKASHKEEIKYIYRFFVGLITPYFQRNPLHTMENYQGEKEEKVRNQ